MSYQLSNVFEMTPVLCLHSPSHYLLIEDYYSTLRQLQEVTCHLEQNQQILYEHINSILSEQQLQMNAIGLVQEYLKAKQVIEKSQLGKQRIRELQQKRKGLQVRLECVRQDADKYKYNIYKYLSQNSRHLKQLHKFCESHSILKICQPLTNTHILNLTHSSPCLHPSSNLCTDSCPFSALKDFIKMYKPNRIYEKICQLWLNMEKQMYRIMSVFMRQYDGQACFREEKEINEEIQEIKKQVMKIKVDVQIGVWEGRDWFGKMGIKIDSNEESFVQQVRHFIEEYRRCQSSNITKQNQSQIKLFNLGDSFQNYLSALEVSKYKCSEYFFKPVLTQLQKLIKFCLSNIKQRNRSMRRVKKLQQQLQRINEQIAYLKLKQTKEEEDNSAGIPRSVKKTANMQKSGNKQRKLSIVDEFYNDRMQQSKQAKRKLEGSNASTKRNSTIEVSCLHKSETMMFRVIKKMHITQNRSSVHSSRSSRPSLHSVSNSSIAPLTQSNSQCQSYLPSPSQRILQLSRHKLLLYRNNPHFRQQIELKRIKQIKIVSWNTLLIYFRKGYIEIQFIQPVCNSEDVYKIGGDVSKTRRQYTRDWISIFQVVYAQYLDVIKIVYQNCSVNEEEEEDKQNVLVKSNLIIEDQDNYEQNQLYEGSERKREQNQFFSFNKISNNCYRIQKCSPVYDINLNSVQSQLNSENALNKKYSHISRSVESRSKKEKIVRINSELKVCQNNQSLHVNRY